MQAKPRPTASPAQALEAMDSLIAAHLLGQQEMAQRLGLNITDLLCFACVLKAGENLLTAGELAEHAHVTTGAMTGILNRRAFAAAGNVRLRGARERDAALAVILFDIDHFKAVNDTHGHDAGDQVLVRVADLVRGVLRDGEILARHGGEEFVVMPAWCGVDAACTLAERLRAAIAAEPLTLNDGHVLRVTASFGVAAAPAAQAVLDDLLHAADLALYRAKRKGRNRVERAG